MDLCTCLFGLERRMADLTMPFRYIEHLLFERGKCKLFRVHRFVHLVLALQSWNVVLDDGSIKFLFEL